MISPFLAHKAWGGRPERIHLLSCNECGFRFYDRGISDQEAERYYFGYRSEEYYQVRHRFEIFYTRKLHEEMGNWLGSAARKLAISRVLEEAGAPTSFAAALDYGGGTGYMLLGIEAGKRAVFDVSKENPVPGVLAYGAREEIESGWGLILSCQVMEHLSDPLDQLKDIAQLLSTGGWVYIEVPDQRWTDLSAPRGIHDAWIRLLLKSRRALHMADFVSTACRVKLRFLPPLGFVPMREHVNFFTVPALAALVSRAGLTVRWSGQNDQTCISAVATRD